MVSFYSVRKWLYLFTMIGKNDLIVVSGCKGFVQTIVQLHHNEGGVSLA